MGDNSIDACDHNYMHASVTRKLRRPGADILCGRPPHY